MLPVLDNEAIREADRHTIEDMGIPSLDLMENAASGVVDALRDSFPEAHRILVLCGRGNNGGDGLAAARLLAGSDLEIKVLLFANPDTLSPDATENLRLATSAGVPIVVIEGEDLTALDAEIEPTHPDLVVDALLGTGIDRPLGGRLAKVVERIEGAGLKVVAVDVPTGLNGSSVEIPGKVMPAELTVTFAALKLCHVLPQHVFAAVRWRWSTSASPTLSSRTVAVCAGSRLKTSRSSCRYGKPTRTRGALVTSCWWPAPKGGAAPSRWRAVPP